MQSPLADDAKPQEKRSVHSVHTSRTIMFAELAAIMAHADHADFQSALDGNTTGKATKFNETKTVAFLRKLYGFDTHQSAFRLFAHFWQVASPTERPLLTLLYAMSRDTLLKESVLVVNQTPTGLKVSTDELASHIAKLYPERYAGTTLLSAAQNLASSWKQAGVLEGKVRSIKKEPPHSALLTAFALLMGYLDGARGGQLFATPYALALMATERAIHEYAHRSALHGYLHYQHLGGVTVVSFDALFQSLNLSAA